MTDSPDGDEPPYTTDELSNDELAKLSIEDQIRYAIYNGNYRIGEIVEISAFSTDWTTDIVEDMVEYGDLNKGTDDRGPFYTLPESKSNRELDGEERERIHETARAEYEAATMVGDPEDVSSALSDDESDASANDAPTDSTKIDGAYASAGEDMTRSDGTPDETDAPVRDDTVDADRAEAEDVRDAIAEHGGLLPVDRRYDWDEHQLDSDEVPDYVSANGEYDDIVQEIETRRETGKLPHFNISGPTGCGKTTLAERIAVDMNAPVFEIHCHEGLRPSNLLGMPTYVGDETWWIDGPAPKALLCSQERPTVVILDEVNRTSSRVLGVLMSMLDHQARVTLDARGGESVQGDPMNLIVFSTMNEGEGYVVNSIDTAQKRRLGNKYYTDYIGMNDPTAESDLIAERTPISREVAIELVETANSIREKADSDSAVSMGVPTDTILDWAATAWAYRDHKTAKGPLVKAGERAVLNKFFRGDDREEDTVRTTIEDHLEGMPIDPEEKKSGASVMSEEVADDDTIDVSDETYLMCEECGWYNRAEDAPDEAATTMSCPECSSAIIPKEST
jgi:nitric oxide reductase NorQ protein